MRKMSTQQPVGNIGMYCDKWELKTCTYTIKTEKDELSQITRKMNYLQTFV